MWPIQNKLHRPRLRFAHSTLETDGKIRHPFREMTLGPHTKHPKPVDVAAIVTKNSWNAPSGWMPDRFPPILPRFTCPRRGTLAASIKCEIRQNLCCFAHPGITAKLISVRMSAYGMEMTAA
jgi:hypothetical protein